MFYERDGRSYLDELYNELPPGDIIRFMPDVDFGFDSFTWEDPVWGRATIDDSWGGKNWQPDEPHYPTMFKKLLLHPAMRRMIGIEQLTLPEQYATIPNAAHFSRWEHITGSALFVKQLVEDWNATNVDDPVDDRQLVVYMLRTMLSDIGHTFGSHMGDWMMDDADEKEHDEQLLDYVNDNGIADLLADYGIDSQEVILTEVEEKDFVERPSPFLCVDRVDYAVREIHRINRYFDDPDKKFTIQDFQLAKDENGVLQLVMKDPQRALLFAKAYELLPQEDWSEPIQRLQTTLYTNLAKLVLGAVARGQVTTPVHEAEVMPYGVDESSWVYESDRHPRDVMMYAEGIIGQTILKILRTSNLQRLVSENGEPFDRSFTVIEDLDCVMRSIARFAQSYYVQKRQHEVADFTGSIAKGEASPTEQISTRTVVENVNTIKTYKGDVLQLSFGDGADSENTRLYEVLLPRRKKRGVDPVVYADGFSVALSALPNSTYVIDNNPYAEMVASVSSDNERIIQSLAEASELADMTWRRILQRPRIGSAQLRYMQNNILTPPYSSN